jgi:hypothetical protein
MDNHTSIQVKNKKEGTFITIANVSHDYSDFADAIIYQLEKSLTNKDYEIVVNEVSSGSTDDAIDETLLLGRKAIGFIKEHPNDASLGKALRTAYIDIANS